MKASKILWVFVFLFSLEAAAQKGFPEAFEITADTATYIAIPEANWQFLLEEKPLTIQQVSGAGYATAFKTNDASDKLFKSYWVRYKIKNSLNRPLDITFPKTTRTTLYIAGPDGKWKHYRTGSNIPWSQKDGLKKINSIIYTLPANGQITVYDHLPGYDAKYLSPYLGIKDNVVKASYIENDEEVFDNLNAAFLSGFLLFTALFNLLFFYIIRERVYLVYTGTLLCGVFTGSPFVLDWWFGESPVLYYWVGCIVYDLGWPLFYITTIMFLKVPRNYPRFYKIFVTANIIYIVLSLVSNAVFWFRIYPEYNGVLTTSLQVFTVSIILCILVAIAIECFRNKRSAWTLFIAFLPVCIFVAFSVITPNSLPLWFNNGFSAAIMWTIVVISWSLFERFRHIINENVQRSLDNERLAREKEEERNALIAQQNEILEIQVAERTSELTHSLEELKQTQNQLIQSEKMASLGELTAGIAHEIQNPLNFVNNFSDVSIELLDEMGEELDKGDVEEAKAISEDIKQNLQKINHHGRRADGIVKGMLQHSRASSGQKETTDINDLADEYLRLAYHGLRAKDKSFNAELVTNFDESLPKINVIPQDIGRVLLNLFTNAFYATQQKSLQSQSVTSGAVGMPAYKPTVSLITSQKGNSIEIIVKDNGTGIPDAIKDKILQPFFTTKPTGEGTGLGLSLSYDIVVKGHGGTIDIESKEGEGSEFIINLPAS